MATYGRYEVVTYPSFYAVTDMQTHKIVGKTTTDRAQAHRKAKRLQKKATREQRP